MKLNLVPARTGALWVRNGLQTFARQPLAFISLFFFFMALVSIASQIPLVGAVIALMLLPTMTLGLMAATAQAAGPEKPPAGTVFLAALHAVRRDARPLLVLGALYAVLFLVVMAISALADGGQFARAYLLGGPLTREIAETTEFQAALWITMAPVPAAVARLLACAGAGALARRAAGQEPVLQLRGLLPQHRRADACSAWSGSACCLGAGIVLSLVASLLVAVGAMGVGDGASAVGGALMIGGALVVAAMFFTTT